MTPHYMRSFRCSMFATTHRDVITWLQMIGGQANEAQLPFCRRHRPPTPTPEKRHVICRLDPAEKSRHIHELVSSPATQLNINNSCNEVGVKHVTSDVISASELSDVSIDADVINHIWKHNYVIHWIWDEMVILISLTRIILNIVWYKKNCRCINYFVVKTALIIRAA